MTKFVLTFGSAHHPWGDCHCIVEAESIAEARRMVFNAIGSHWCSVDPIDYLPEIARYGGREVRWKDVVMCPPRPAFAKELAE